MYKVFNKKKLLAELFGDAITGIDRRRYRVGKPGRVHRGRRGLGGVFSFLSGCPLDLVLQQIFGVDDVAVILLIDVGLARRPVNGSLGRYGRLLIQPVLDARAFDAVDLSRHRESRKSNN